MPKLSVKAVTSEYHMEKIVFECSGLKDALQFRFEKGFIFISVTPRNDELMFNENDLILISYANHPWMMRGCMNNIELTFTYNDQGRQKKKLP